MFRLTIHTLVCVFHVLNCSSFILPMKNTKNIFLEGPFSPVKERTIKCKTVGVIPDVVSKTIFARVGPNPMFEPKYGYHLFDGDGMIHWVSFENSTAVYRNRFVKTLKVRAEESAGRSLYPNPIGYFLKPFAILRLGFNYILQLLCIIPFIHKSELSVANTNIIQHSSEILAMCEGGLPYSLKFTPSELQTNGVHSYNGFVKDSFTAHPKINPRDSWMYGMGSNGSNEICIYVFDQNGKPHHKFGVDFRYPILMHDLAITSKHIILLDMPLMYQMDLILQGKMPVCFDKSFTSRIGVIEMDDVDGSSLKWYTVPGESFLISHVVNAYSELNKIHLISCDISDFSMTNVLSSKSSIHEIIIDTDSGAVTRTPVLRETRETSETSKSLDFPVIDTTRTGLKNRYVYTTEFKNGLPSNIFKIDLFNRQIVGSIILKPGEYSGDCSFVPNGTDDEDDGYLLSFVSNSSSSRLCVWSTKKMDLVGHVEIPAYIPVGFHSTILLKLESQNSSNFG